MPATKCRRVGPSGSWGRAAFDRNVEPDLIKGGFRHAFDLIVGARCTHPDRYFDCTVQPHVILVSLATLTKHREHMHRRM